MPTTGANVTSRLSYHLPACLCHIYFLFFLSQTLVVDSSISSTTIINHIHLCQHCAVEVARGRGPLPPPTPPHALGWCPRSPHASFTTHHHYIQFLLIPQLPPPTPPHASAITKFNLCLKFSHCIFRHKPSLHPPFPPSLSPSSLVDNCVYSKLMLSCKKQMGQLTPLH